MAMIPPPPPGLDIHDTNYEGLYISMIITFVLAVVIVALRFWCRRITRVGYKWDDWFVVIALAVATANLVIVFVWIHRGLGHHIWALPPTWVFDFYQLLFAQELVYILQLVFVKYSILAFYLRIFSTPIRIPVFVVAACVTLWGVACILATVFQCVPPSDFWKHPQDANCGVNIHKFFFGNAVPNIVTDAAILCLPLPFIFRLHRTTAQKIALTGIFMLGIFVPITSIVRLVLLLGANAKSVDLDWIVVESSIWTIVEVNVAVICACLPSLRPVLSMITHGSPNRSRYLEDQYTHSSGAKSNSTTNNRWLKAFGSSTRVGPSKATNSYGATHGDDIENELDSRRWFVPLSDQTGMGGGEVGTETSAAAELGRAKSDGSFERGLGTEMGALKSPYKAIHVRRDTKIERTDGS